MQTALANDCHSWERERRTTSSQDDAGFVANAIWVLMHRQSMTLEEAETVCRARAKEYAAEYLRVVESASGRDDLCRDAKFLLDTLRFGISGNIAWGLQCPRYHVERKLTPAQCEMGKTVRANQAIGWHHVQISVKKGVGRHSAVKTNGAVVNGVHRQAVAVVRDVPALGMEVSESSDDHL
jgi:fusicocca-2,10(14)-diene synthase/ophiobolin F synthase